MTMFNVSLKPNETHIVCDTAVSHPTLGFTGFRTKPVILAHLNCVMLHSGSTWLADTLSRWLNHAPLTDIEDVFTSLPDALRTVAAMKEDQYGVGDTYESRSEFLFILGWSDRKKQCVGFRVDVDGTDVGSPEWLKPGFIWQPSFPDQDTVRPNAKVPDVLIKFSEAVAPLANAENTWSGIGGELLHLHISRSGIKVAKLKPLYNNAEIRRTLAGDPDKYAAIAERQIFAIA